MSVGIPPIMGQTYAENALEKEDSEYAPQVLNQPPPCETPPLPAPRREAGTTTSVVRHAHLKHPTLASILTPGTTAARDNRLEPRPLSSLSCTSHLGNTLLSASSTLSHRL
jgi:hypothetical protein